MFVILTYDIEEKRINRVRKLLKKYLIWTQNSVFEGEITEGKLHKCLSEINKHIDKKTDSIYIYRVKMSKNITKDVIGIEKSFDELFL
ncbi:CRISPR-associated endonuclease Cas2 [Clostridium botulinum]|uniref:CRISPR-associated endoribonuclease Cas2 n=1 Tax=Clostridium botulinum C/D str. DC5 TaxID=1443128 RepID=A0A0A0IF90_CLOBO|nr:CRISPR-associated endonuclease Cas2 [Clostridium botulinum]KGM99193.1 CRISPR-associated protein Cas2 [Clostridium botulinum C/D str. DC5]KOC51036.1 CRISPR-associated protein Cas2 [Clostridium botulinum]KOC53213.1 CRISPR-associated protein Cas2 [Clostridium botulinum]MCD3235252.1 CRISPR-associated endonuclease Cas2 [Clostridium botulinum D/C]MCD3241173.1 CRISPR-associated endonuclease Cas2 [Clostridium botulinum D/C]